MSARSPIKSARALLSDFLDMIVHRYVPDVEPIVFDEERARWWRDAVEGASVTYGPAAKSRA